MPDLPPIPPRGGYRTTNYQMSCPECGARVWAHYVVPADAPGRAVIHPGPDHTMDCSYYKDHDNGT
jgi:hypothetical protein